MFYTESQIQKLAFEEGIIAEELYKELSELYDHRNAFVHRCFLTDLEYGQLPEILERYEVAYKKLYKIVYDLEAAQIQLGVGMTVPGRSTDESERAIKEEVLKKIDSSGAVFDPSRKTEAKNVRDPQ